MIETFATLATSAGLGIGAGLNAYATFLVFGLLSRYFPTLFHGELAAFFSSTPALILFGALYCVEFIADKIPAVDHVWDVIHTFIRPLAGVVVALAAASPDLPKGVVATAAILSGSAALGSHVTKASLRAASTASTAGIANPFLSLVEDLIAVATSALAIFLPFVLAAVAILLFIPTALFLRRRTRSRPVGEARP